jgi:hypothetical protein
MDKIVVHRTDGVVKKGHSADFSPTRPYFHLATIQRPFDSEKVYLESLKAVFFVRDFTGDPTHIDLKGWRMAPGSGRHVIVTFKDGEKLYGTAESIHRDHMGFYLYPADPLSNTTKAYAVNTFIESVKLDEA